MAAFRLLDLPEELQLSIIENVHNRSTLCNLARACRHLQSLAEPLIYRNILVRSAKDALSFISRLESRTDRARSVHCVDARLRDADEAYTGLLRGPNLQEVRVESPFCNRIRQETATFWNLNIEGLFQSLCNSGMPRLTSGKCPRDRIGLTKH